MLETASLLVPDAARHGSLARARAANVAAEAVAGRAPGWTSWQTRPADPISIVVEPVDDRLESPRAALGISATMACRWREAAPGTNGDQGDDVWHR